MKPKAIIKLSVDILMSVLLLTLMGYQLWGEEAHEWIGIGMFILFVLHHILNASWHKSLFKGKYTAVRTLTLVIDLLVLISMLAQLYSGIVMSRYAFDFLSIDSGMALARQLHILGSYWGFILMGLHLGMHWNMIMNMLKKRFSVNKPSKLKSVITPALGMVIAAYGAYVFIKRDFLTYMLLKSEFVFLNYDESKILFYIDYLALMGLFVFISHYLSWLLRSLRKRKAAKQ